MGLKDLRAAAVEIGMSPEWLRKKVQAGAVEHHRFGRSVRFSDEQIEQIKAEHLRPRAPSVPAFVSVPTILASRPRPAPRPRPRPPKPPKTAQLAVAEWQIGRAQ
jgi:hypothetical protein